MASKRIFIAKSLSAKLRSTFTAVARVAQWLERRAQRSDDPCVGGSGLSNETV
jgi:hypothetical protein